MGNEKLIILISILIHLLFGLSVNAKELSVPVRVMDTGKESKEKEIFPPSEVAVIVDLSGSMNYYTQLGFKESALQYILRNLGTIWIPSVEVTRESRIKKYFVKYVYRFGRNIELLQTNDLKAVFDPPPDPGFYKSTEIHEAIEEVVKLLNPKGPKVSMVVLISDMEIEIGSSKKFPKGSAPYHVIEPLRELYTAPMRSPGWWILGVRVPYKWGNNTFLRPMFLSVWGYDIKPIRKMLKYIKREIQDNFKGPKGLPEGHLIEIFPSDHWVPASGEKWKPKGVQKYEKDESPFSWIASKNSFRCERNKTGKISFKIGISRDTSMREIESPYLGEISAKLTDSKSEKLFYIDPKSFSLKDDVFHFTMEIFCNSIKGKMGKPDRAEILLNASYKMEEDLFSWLNEWSKKEEPGNVYDNKVTNLKHLFSGAFEIARPPKDFVESQPIILEFWK